MVGVDLMVVFIAGGSVRDSAESLCKWCVVDAQPLKAVDGVLEVVLVSVGDAALLAVR